MPDRSVTDLPAIKARLSEQARLWMTQYPYGQTGGAGRAYAAFLAAWPIMKQISAFFAASAASTTACPEHAEPSQQTSPDAVSNRVAPSGEDSGQSRDIPALLAEVDRLSAALNAQPQAGGVAPLDLQPIKARMAYTFFDAEDFYKLVAEVERQRAEIERLRQREALYENAQCVECQGDLAQLEIDRVERLRGSAPPDLSWVNPLVRSLTQQALWRELTPFQQEQRITAAFVTWLRGSAPPAPQGE